MGKLTLFTLTAVAILHVLASWGISTHYDRLVDGQVVPAISAALIEDEITRKDLFEKLDIFNRQIKPAYYLSIALSLPAGPILQPFYRAWFSDTVLSRETGLELFNKGVTFFAGVQLIVNAIFFSSFLLFLWTLAGKPGKRFSNQAVESRRPFS
ncbi:MAG: hypothetical protein KKG47_15240 [Proteobacteria bacterium]|nr:hypothetical protein [Pseudomonadota bacterium]MBU1737441.1 hypothetical protein [Pseudomonadota bacterium]